MTRPTPGNWYDGRLQGLLKAARLVADAELYCVADCEPKIVERIKGAMILVIMTQFHDNGGTGDMVLHRFHNYADDPDAMDALDAAEADAATN